MKRLLIVLFSVLVAVLFVLSAVAETVYVSDGFLYQHLDDNYITISGWDNSGNTVRVPATLDGFPIREISDGAFKDNSTIESVDFSNAEYMNTIGNFAFKDCLSLSGNVSIPARIKQIGWGAFQGCTGISSVNYYYGTSYIPVQCFYQCDSLERAVINDGVQTIEKLAFADCTNLSYVRIPTSVETISASAFNNCPNLTIYCYTDSYAQQYAIDNGIEYVLIDAPAPTEPMTDENTEPTAEIPTSEPVEVTFILGDADGDGFVTIVDATVIQRVLVELHPDPDGMVALRGSADGDTLNILHATKIQRWLAMYEVEEPIGTEVTRTLG